MPYFTNVGSVPIRRGDHVYAPIRDMLVTSVGIVKGVGTNATYFGRADRDLAVGESTLVGKL